jgi:hypothetical protein
LAEKEEQRKFSHSLYKKCSRKKRTKHIFPSHLTVWWLVACPGNGGEVGFFEIIMGLLPLIISKQLWVGIFNIGAHFCGVKRSFNPFRRHKNCPKKKSAKVLWLLA